LFLFAAVFLAVERWRAPMRSRGVAEILVSLLCRRVKPQKKVVDLTLGKQNAMSCLPAAGARSTPPGTPNAGFYGKER
jgi:hypothetical protein